MSLYNKYRPKVFADVQGQQHVVATLERAASSGKLAHAYLFAGSRGIGKTTIARLLAKEVMIHGIEDEQIRKNIQKGVDDGNIVDLLEIDAASNRGIDDVRELIDKMQFSPVIAKAKVYIIDEVHMLTKEAFNALLKTLEEPPEFAYFILATTELNKIPTTIQSRCQCFPFRHIREEDIVRRLQYIADQEHITIDREALRAIALGSEGGMRDAISLLDQLQSLEKITLEDVKSRTGATGMEYSMQALEAIAANDREAILENIAKIEEAGISLDVFLRHLLKSTRELLHESIAMHQNTGRSLAILNTLLKAIRDMRTSPVPGLVVEAALLSLCTDEQQESHPTQHTPVPQKKEVAQEQPPKSKETEETSPPVRQEQPPMQKKDEESISPTNNEIPSNAIIEAPELSMQSIQKTWPTVVNAVTPSSAKMSLKNGRVIGLEKKNVVISFSSSFHRDKVQSTESSRTIEDILEKTFKQKLTLQCILDDKVGNHEAPTITNDDMVNMADAAAEIF